MPKKQKRLERAVVVGDTQFPFADANAVELFYQFLKKFQPQKIFFNGDMVDFYVLSRYKKSPHLNVKLEEEIEETIEFIEKVRKICPDADIIWIEGNHEYRLKAFIYEQAPQLAELKQLSFENLFELDRLNVQYKGLPDKVARYAHSFVEYKGFLIGHFAKVNQHGGYTAKSLIDTFGKNIIQNHTHRMGAHIRKTYDGFLEGYESGSLCSDDPAYGTFMNWSKGWGYLETINNSTHYYQIMLKDDKFVWNGELYSV